MRFGSVLTAMVTPFAEDGALDLDAAQKLASHLIENGNDGVVVAGTTGEAPTISAAEQKDLFVAVREAVPNATMIAGTGSNDTSSAIKNGEAAEAAGADALLAVTPYYNRPSQEGLYQHFQASAAATTLPVMLYDIPVRTGRKIDTETILRLIEIDNIVALKDAAGNPGATSKLIAEAPDDFEVFSGDDGLTLPLLSVGAVGVVGVATHWVGKEMAEMIAAFRAGNVARALELNQRMLPSFDYETSDDAPNPIPTKKLLNLTGVRVGRCRPPMVGEPDDLEQRAKEVLRGLERSV